MIVDRASLGRTAVGASEVGAVLGCDPWTTPLQLYRRKLGLDDPRPATAAMELGSALEGAVVNLARWRIPLPVRRNRRTFVRPVAPFLFATPDAFVGTDRLLEAKVLGLRSPEAFDDDELPCRVKLQVQAQLFVTDREAAYVAQLVGTELRLTTVQADPDVQVEILNAADRFAELLANGTPPDPLSWDERWAGIIARLSPLPDREVLAGGSVQDAGDRILAIRGEQKRLEDEERTLRVELLEALADGQGSKLVGSGWTGSLQETAGRTDWKAVALELQPDPAIVERHRSAASTTFVVRSSRRDS